MGSTLDFFECFQQEVEKSPETIALQAVSREGVRESYSLSRIASEINAISLHLIEQGLKPGDTVGILMENHPRWGIAFLAAQSAGARIVPFDVMHSAATLAHLVEHADCRFLFSSAQLLEKFESIQKSLPEPLLAVLAAVEHEAYPSWEGIVSSSDSKSYRFPLVERDLDDVFLLVYTSGTTGNPKGVMLSQRSIYQSVIQVLETVEVLPSDHILGVLPLYHMLALMANFLIPLYLGARVTYLDSIEPQRILKAFQEEGISIFVCVPQFYYVMHRRIFQEVEGRGFVARLLFKRLLKLSHFMNHRLGLNPGRTFFKPIHRKFPALSFFAVGGARFDAEIAESFVDLGFPMIQAYGMTETSAVSTVAGPGVKGLGSVGRPLKHAQLRINQPDANGIGEVLISGLHIMKGYWKNQEATDETLADDWLHTGDLGYLDDGFLYITGRKKDVIVLSSGKNIFPEEIEQTYEKEIPLIKEMCVVGIADALGEEGEEKLHAVIVPDLDYAKSQQVVNAADMIRYLMENKSQAIPQHKRVRSFEVWQDPLPRTTTRKIKRFEVQEMVVEKSLRSSSEAPQAQGSEPKSPTEARLFELLKATGKIAVVNREMNLELDCGFDSLERVEFMSNVQERFQIQISDEAATQILTVQELVEAVEKRLSGEVSGEKESGPVSWAEILRAPLDEDDRQQVHQILRRRRLTELFYFFLTRIDWLLCKLFLRFQVEGQENLPRDYPYLICPNHLSYLDGFVLAAALPLRLVQRLFFLGYSDYFGGTLMSFFGSLIKIVPVDANRYLRQALRLGSEGLSQGLVLSVFPEGERSIDGSLKTFRKGPSILACQLEVPVVPVAIVGTYAVWRRGSNRIRLHPVTVRFGKPILPPAGLRDYDEFNRRLREAVAELIESNPKG